MATSSMNDNTQLDMPGMLSLRLQEDLADILDSVNMYNPEHKQDFEMAVQEQCQEGTYSLQLNLALLKLYQFNPYLTNLDIVKQIMVKALMSLPQVDFSLCLCLLGKEASLEKDIEVLKSLHQALEECRFVDFWTEYESEKELFKCCPHFEDCIRTYIVGVIALSFQTISTARAATYLHLDDATAYMTGLGCTISKDEITLPASEDNTSKPNIIQTNIRFEQLSKIIGKAMR